MPAVAQHLRNILARPCGVSKRTTSGFLPQKRQFASWAFCAARAVTLVLDVSFLAILFSRLRFAASQPQSAEAARLLYHIPDSIAGLFVTILPIPKRGQRHGCAVARRRARYAVPISLPKNRSETPGRDPKRRPLLHGPTGDPCPFLIYAPGRRAALR